MVMRGGCCAHPQFKNKKRKTNTNKRRQLTCRMSSLFKITAKAFSLKYLLYLTHANK
jgi:hypothetical protein